MPRKLRDLIASKDGSRKVTLNNETMANESINRSKKKKKKKANTIIGKICMKLSKRYHNCVCCSEIEPFQPDGAGHDQTNKVCARGDGEANHGK